MLTLVFSILFMLSVVLLMLLALGIVSLPVSSDDSPPNDLSSFRRRIVERCAFSSLTCDREEIDLFGTSAN